MDTNTKKRFIIRISILAVVFAAGIFGLYVYSGYLKNRSEYLAKKELADEVDSYADVAYPGKNLADTDLSGLSEDEITRILDEELNAVSGRSVTIQIDEDIYRYSMSDFNEVIYYRCDDGEIYKSGDTDKLAKRIVEADKDLSADEQKKIIDGTRLPTAIDVELICSPGTEMLKSVISEYTSKYDYSPKNATINSKLKVKKDKSGKVLDTSLINSDLSSYLGSDSKEDLVKSYRTKSIAATIKASYLKKIKKCIGSYTTSFIPDNARGRNIKIASKRINGILLNPGEEVSFLDRLYDDSDGKEYEESGGFLDNKVVQVEGGGICQVSTTAYDAFLVSGIVPVERHPHTCPVSYVPMGLDAALAIGTKDLVVKNTYDVPILLCSKVKGSNLTVSVYSYKKAKGSYTYKPKSISTKGELRARSYLDVYLGGDLVDSIALSDDVYKKAKS